MNGINALKRVGRRPYLLATEGEQINIEIITEMNGTVKGKNFTQQLGYVPQIVVQCEKETKPKHDNNNQQDRANTSCLLERRADELLDAANFFIDRNGPGLKIGNVADQTPLRPVNHFNPHRQEGEDVVDGGIT